MELPTKRLDPAAEAINEIHRQRWQIELFFKAIKQHLRIKVDTSANAVRIQFWTVVSGIRNVPNG